MAHPVFDKMKAYYPKWNKRELYESTFSFFLEANGITDAKKKRAMLLACIGAVGHAFVRDMNRPKELSDNTVIYNVLICQLWDHFGKRQLRCLLAIALLRCDKKNTSQ